MLEEEGLAHDASNIILYCILSSKVEKSLQKHHLCISFAYELTMQLLQV